MNVLTASVTMAVVSTCTLAVAANAAVQNGRTGFDNWERCSALRDIAIPPDSIGIPTRAAKVNTANLVPAGGLRMEPNHDPLGRPKSVPVFTTDLNPYGEYCLVTGEIEPTVPDTNKVVFHLALPSRWNGNSLHVDGRGDNNPPAPVRPINFTIVMSPPLPIARGYAVYSREWNGNKRLYDIEPTKRANDVSMFLIETFYGRAARHRYYAGTGGAGYESLTLIQKYPDDDDGVVTQAPFFSVATSTLHGEAIRRATEFDGGAGKISTSKAALLRRKVLAACDNLDGLTDSIVSNVEGCHVDFTEFRCADGKDGGDDCFSDAQLRTLQVLHTHAPLPSTLPSGETHLPAFPLGADWDSAARSNLAKANEGRSKAGDRAVAELFFPGEEEDADVLAFDPLKPSGEALKRMQEVSRLFDRSSPDIGRFIARGGKWILTHGWADEFAPATSSIEYYRRLVAKYAKQRSTRSCACT